MVGKRIALVRNDPPSGKPKKVLQDGGKKSNQPSKHASYGPAVWEMAKKLADQGLGRVKLARRLGIPIGRTRPNARIRANR